MTAQLSVVINYARDLFKVLNFIDFDKQTFREETVQFLWKSTLCVKITWWRCEIFYSFFTKKVNFHNIKASECDVYACTWQKFNISRERVHGGGGLGSMRKYLIIQSVKTILSAKIIVVFRVFATTSPLSEVKNVSLAPALSQNLIDIEKQTFREGTVQFLWKRNMRLKNIWSRYEKISSFLTKKVNISIIQGP